MPQINIRSSKKGTLIDLLSKDIDRRRNYTLYIASCYFTPDAAKKFIQQLLRQIKISQIIVYIDRKEAFQ